MHKVVLIKNALQDRSALQSPIGPMPRSNLTPPCPILAHNKRSQTPPPPAHSRLRQTGTGATITPPSVSRRLPRSSFQHAVHQPVRLNSPPPIGVFSGTIQCPHPRQPTPFPLPTQQIAACSVEAAPTPPLRNNNRPCCC